MWPYRKARKRAQQKPPRKQVNISPEGYLENLLYKFLASRRESKRVTRSPPQEGKKKNTANQHEHLPPILHAPKNEMQNKPGW
jgi:hypothetical protein